MGSEQSCLLEKLVPFKNSGELLRTFLKVSKQKRRENSRDNQDVCEVDP